MSLVLASASPRRAELLRAAGFLFVVHATDVDESQRLGETADAYVARVAEAKLAAARRAFPVAVVLAADTTVVVDGTILGKPADDRDAESMLRRLSGRSHLVLTGVALEAASGRLVEVATTIVHFSAMTEADLAWYIASGEPRDKAGAYGIQGLASRFIDRIEGSYTNVVGLPVALVARRLAQLGVQRAAFQDASGNGGRLSSIRDH